MAFRVNGNAVPVPEPSTLAHFAIGLAGLGFFGWRGRTAYEQPRHVGKRRTRFWGLALTTKRPVIPVPMSDFVLISSVLPQATDILDKTGNVSG